MIIKGAEPFEFGEGSHGILFIHGWTSSPREMRFLAESLKDRFSCKGILLEGHGQTPRALAGTSWHGHLEQVKENLAQMRSELKTVSIAGLSYGGILALHAAVDGGADSLIMLSPFTRSSRRVMGLIRQSSLVRFLPGFIGEIKKKGSGPINDPAELARHIRYSVMPLEPMKSLLECARSAMSLAEEITCPVLLMHSTADMTADYRGSTKLYERLGCGDKTFIPLKKSGHIITLDYEREQVEKEVGGWLGKRILS